MIIIKPFKQIWAADFEFSQPVGERPKPVCLVAWELSGNQKLRLWLDELRCLKAPPYPIGKDILFIAYTASAEMGCHLSLGWQLPVHILDLYTEFRNLTNGRFIPCGWGLLGAMTYYGLNCIDAVEKESMRKLAMRGEPFTDEERIALLKYCESDVSALAKLLPRMLPKINIPYALLRGRYMKAVACIEHNGIPIDMPNLTILREGWESIKQQLIREIDKEYGVYEGLTFKRERWAKWLDAHNVPWPRLPETGVLELKDETFRDMSIIYPMIAPMYQLRASLSKMKLANLAVGSDGRNRCSLKAFGTKTSRNAPSTSEFIFCPAVWIRGLILPQHGAGVAYVDWEQQEYGIAAVLSGDPKKIEAYQTGDPYLAFAKQVGAVPPDATKATHGTIREQYKQTVLAVQFGMGAELLSLRIGKSVDCARELLRMHRETYKTFWSFSDGAVDYAMLYGRLWTVFDWNIYTEKESNPRTLSNFPMQANAAEMLRLACCLATERGIKVCAPIHDALLIEAPLEQLDATVEATQKAMAEASAIVLDGFQVRTDAKVVCYPDHYMDERGVPMWNKVWWLIKGLNIKQPVHQCTTKVYPKVSTGEIIPVHTWTPV